MNNDVDNYLMEFSDEKRVILDEYREIIINSNDDLKEKISWGMPSYFINKYIIHFAGHKNHIGIYPGDKAVEKFKSKLKNYKHSKGAIQIKYSDEIPKDLILEIIDYNIDMDKKNFK